MQKSLKLKKCSVCNTKFSPYSSLSKTCSVPCSIESVALAKDKQERRRTRVKKKALRERKKALKSRAEWLAEAQRACNAYIRERDKGLGCISCGTMKPDIQYCAGHYKTRGGHPELRFHPMNINLQCNQYCNLQLSGNIAKYRINLVKKIGISQVAWLEGAHTAQNLTIDEIKEIKEFYKQKLKEVKP